MRLFRSITLILVLLTTVPITVVGLILTDSTIDIIKTLTWELEQERAERTARAASTYLENIIDDLDLLVSNLNLGRMTLDEQKNLLGFILQKRPEVNIIGLYDRAGRPLTNLLAFDAARILPSELAQHIRMLTAIEREETRSHLAAFSPTYHIERAPNPDLGIERRDERAVGVVLQVDAADAVFLCLELSLEPLSKLIERMRTSQRGALLLVGSDLRPIAYSATDGSAIADVSTLTQELPLLVGTGLSELSVSGARPVRMPDGREFLAAFSPLIRPDWRVVSFEPLDNAYQTARRMMWHVLWVVLASLSVAIGLGVLFVFGLTRPIAGLVRGALEIARGRFGTQIEVKVRNEVAELAHTFNYMSNQLLYYDQQNQELLQSVERGYVETLRALANSIDAKDPYTAGHSDRVTEIAVAVSRELGLSGEQQKIIRYAGILHDIGKIGIPEAILGKKGQLTEAERDQMRQHPVLGDKIIAPIDFLKTVRPLVRHHHEWVDGSGYPDGLRGEQVPLGAQIIAAADTYDAITSERPYQKPFSDDEAIAILVNRLRGRQFDTAVCDALIQVIEQRRAKDQLEASGGLA